MQLHYEHEFHSALAEALENHDLEMLRKVEQATDDWMGMSHEKEPRQLLIDSARSMIENYKAIEEEVRELHEELDEEVEELKELKT